MVGVITPGSDSGVFALLNAISDPAATKATLAAILSAKADADVRVADAAKRESAVSAREVDASVKDAAIKAQADAMNKASVLGSQAASKLSQDQTQFAQDKADWEALRDQQAKAIGAREIAVAAAEATLTKGNIALLAKMAEADALQAKYAAIVDGAKKLIGG